MKYRLISRLLLFTFFVQSSGMLASPFGLTSPTVSYEEKQRLKKMDYYTTLAMIAWSTGEFDSYKKVPGAIADFVVTDLACKSLCKYSGLKNKRWALPFMPFVALGGKQAIKYGITACKNGYKCKGELKKRYGNKKWIPYFLMGIFVPYVLRKEITNKAFGVVDKKTGLTQVGYPEWILNSTLLTVLAWQFHGAVIDWCGDMIQSAYDAVVPETKTQKYLRIKSTLKRISQTA